MILVLLMEPNLNVAITLEVVNQYCRAPKLFYWLEHIQTSDRTVGVCLHSCWERMLFEAPKLLLQLEMEMFTDLLGSLHGSVTNISSSTLLNQLLQSGKSVSHQ